MLTSRDFSPPGHGLRPCTIPRARRVAEAGTRLSNPSGSYPLGVGRCARGTYQDAKKVYPCQGGFGAIVCSATAERGFFGKLSLFRDGGFGAREKGSLCLRFLQHDKPLCIPASSTRGAIPPAKWNWVSVTMACAVLLQGINAMSLQASCRGIGHDDMCSGNTRSSPGIYGILFSVKNARACITWKTR